MAYPVDSSTIRFYHAHIYYDDASRGTAARLRAEIEQRFEVVMGRWRDEPVGPHPQAMYQVKFDPAEFARIVPWLMINRAGLNILVHPDTGDAIADHAVNALWLGDKLPLRIDILRQFVAAQAEPAR
ncbi:MAG TPA: DOPA 4,5-dioxygenase family protein [Candidatus Binataceae bacterium]|jgi:DOPA 4,5-dioxygenase|nr:DOPA 4,5-dioxygenase family protein [Candidatus Binataceae bacterium]